MAFSKRFGATALGVVAAALTVTGVVLAATDPNPTGIAKDPLALNGYPPKSAEISLVISTGQGYDVHANVDVNFQTNAVEAVVQIPLVFSGVTADLRALNGHLYASTANLSSVIGTRWLSTSLKVPALFGYSLELVRPDLSLITGFAQTTVMKNGYFTTYDFVRHNVAVARLGAAKGALPVVGSLEWRITTGSEGEVTSSALIISAKGSETVLSATVLSYNRPAAVVAPASNEVTPESSTFLAKLLRSTPIASLLVPQNFASLGNSSQLA